MAIADLKDVYIDQLQDLHSANKQAREVTERMANAASDDALRDALRAGVAGIERGLEAMDRVIRHHGADPEGEVCKGMEGLVREAKAHALDAEIATDEARDAMIITQYQRMAHYAIAGYGCCAAFARRLGFGSEADVLEECLANTRDGDERLTRIATQDVNAKAA